VVPAPKNRKEQTDELNPTSRNGSAEVLSHDMRIVLKLIDQNRTLTIPMDRETIIAGRTTENFQPHLDLTGVDGSNCGVSRKHAALSYRGGDLFIEDLNSTNGTLINGLQLTPGRAYMLRNGDEVELGQLRVAVNVIRIPPRA